MSEKQWYEDLPREEIEGKHVRAVLSSGTVIEGSLEYWDNGLASIGSLSEGNYVLRGSEKKCWKLTTDVKRLDLVWDERDWDRIDVKDVRVGDAVVVDGVLYEVTKASLVHTDYPCVGTDALGRNPIDLRLVSCALRRKVQVPVKPGYYRDQDGAFWKMWFYDKGDPVWQPVLVDIDTSHVYSSLEMERLMPLTPVHFESGRAA